MSTQQTAKCMACGKFDTFDDFTEGYCPVCFLKNNPEAQQELQERVDRDREADERAHQILLSSTDTIPGKTTIEYFGFVRGSTCRSKIVFRDITASLKNIVGGEIVGYTQLMAEAREEALHRMRMDAFRLGANAIIGVSFSTAMIDVGTAEVTAFGTAIRVAED